MHEGASFEHIHVVVDGDESVTLGQSTIPPRQPAQWRARSDGGGSAACQIEAQIEARAGSGKQKRVVEFELKTFFLFDFVTPTFVFSHSFANCHNDLSRPLQDTAFMIVSMKCQFPTESSVARVGFASASRVCKCKSRDARPTGQQPSTALTCNPLMLDRLNQSYTLVQL